MSTPPHLDQTTGSTPLAHKLQSAITMMNDGLDLLLCQWEGEQAKAPLSRVHPNGHKSAFNDLKQFARALQQNLDAMIAAVVPEAHVVIDIDPRNDGTEQELIELTGELPATKTTISGRNDGGKHLWFTLPDGVKLSSRNLPKGIDLKQNGYVIVPPSLHPATGEPYRWEDPNVPVAELPATAIEALNAPRQTHPRSEPIQGQRTATVAPLSAVGRLMKGREYETSPDDVTPLDDYERRVSWREILEPEGWTISHVMGDTTYWTRPGKTSGVSATTGHDPERDRFYPFTSSTVFEPETSYTKQSAYALLHHGGDHSAAASALRRQGYGTPSTPKVATSMEHGAQDGASDPVDPAESTWAPIDLTPYLDGSYTPPVASIMERTDGPCLLYPGKVHSLSGESESGKSMIAIAEVAQQLKAHQPVLFLDYESDAATVVDRLLKMGATKQQILDHFDYRLPEVDPVTATVHDIQAWQQLLANTYTLAVLDGVTEALGVSNASSMDNDEVTHWIRKVPRAIADHTGAATLLIDHVTKSRETRGRFAIGAQSKLSALSGAAYIVEPVEPLGVGMLGILQLKVAKDRPGQVRPHSKGWDQKDRLAIIAEAVIDSTNPLTIDYRLEPPSEQLSPDDVQLAAWEDLKARIVQEIGDLHDAQNVKPSFSKLNKSVKGRTENIREALEELIQEGRVLSQPGQRNAMFLSLPEKPA